MSKKIKQMSYLSMIIFIVGSTIGAGIFIKNKTIARLSHGEFGPLMATWGVAVVGIMALALSLVELSSAQKTDKGTLEWTKLFTPKWFHRSSTNFTKYIFMPLTLFTTPLYVVSSLQLSGLKIEHGIVALSIAFGIFLWFMLINIISFRFSEISQWVFTVIQIVPLVVLPIVAYINPLSMGEILDKEVQVAKGINGTGPWIAMIAGISSITFAFDGFYTITSMKEKTNGKASLGAGLVLGVTFVTLVYLFLTIAFSVGSTDGTHNGVKWIVDNPTFARTMNIFIAVGILSVINGYSMSFPRQMRSLATSGESQETMFLHKVIFKKKYVHLNARQLEISGWTYTLVATSFLFVTLGTIGVYVYKINENTVFGSVGTLYTLSDTLVNFNSLLMFIIITTSVLGAIINRRKKTVEVKKSRYFLPAAWVCVVIFYSAGAYMIGTAFLDMFNIRGDFEEHEIASSIIKFAVFAGVIAISTFPAFAANASKIKLGL